MSTDETTITLGEGLDHGTLHLDPGNDPWPMQHILVLTPEGEIDCEWDLSGGGWAVSDATVLGPVDGSLTGQGLRQVAEHVLRYAGDSLRKILNGHGLGYPVADRGREAPRGDGARSATDDRGAQVDHRPDPVEEFTGQDTPEEWIAHIQRDCDHVIIDLPLWLRAEVQDRLEALKRFEIEGLEPDTDAGEDSVDELLARAVWWDLRGKELR